METYHKSNNNIQNQKTRSTIETIEQWHQQHYVELFNLGFKSFSNKSIVKDAIQDTFLELWQKQHLIPDIKYPRAYLKKVFVRKMAESVSLEKNARNLLVDSEQETISYEDRLIAFQDDSDKKIKLSSFLELIPPKQKRMLEMKFLEGYSYEEIAKITGKTKRTVYNQVFKALHFLKKGFSKFRT